MMRGIAQLVRLGWFRQVHVKSAEAQRIRMLPVNRQQLLTKALDLENSVRGSLKVFGLRIGTVTRTAFGSVNWSGKTAAWSPSPDPCCGSSECYSRNLSASIACIDSWPDAIPSAVG